MRYAYSSVYNNMASVVVLASQPKCLHKCNSVYTIIAHCGHTSKGCSTMINPIQLGDIDITQDVVRVISISPRKCSDTRDEA